MVDPDAPHLLTSHWILPRLFVVCWHLPCLLPSYRCQSHLLCSHLLMSCQCLPHLLPSRWLPPFLLLSPGCLSLHLQCQSSAHPLPPAAHVAPDSLVAAILVPNSLVTISSTPDGPIYFPDDFEDAILEDLEWDPLSLALSLNPWAPASTCGLGHSWVGHQYWLGSKGGPDQVSVSWMERWGHIIHAIRLTLPTLT